MMSRNPCVLMMQFCSLKFVVFGKTFADLGLSSDTIHYDEPLRLYKGQKSKLGPNHKYIARRILQRRRKKTKTWKNWYN